MLKRYFTPSYIVLVVAGCLGLYAGIKSIAAGLVKDGAYVIVLTLLVLLVLHAAFAGERMFTQLQPIDHDELAWDQESAAATEAFEDSVNNDASTREGCIENRLTVQGIRDGDIDIDAEAKRAGLFNTQLPRDTVRLTPEERRVFDEIADKSGLGS